MRVIWDTDAVADLTRISFHIGQDSKRSALKVIDYIERAALVLEASPFLGKATSRLNVRQFVLSKFPYILIYKVLGDEVHILSVRHHRQKRS